MMNRTNAMIDPIRTWKVTDPLVSISGSSRCSFSEAPQAPHGIGSGNSIMNRLAAVCDLATVKVSVFRLSDADAARFFARVC